MSNENAMTSSFEELNTGLTQVAEFEKSTDKARPTSYSVMPDEDLEIRNFIGEGLRDVQRGALSDFDVAFDRLEKRYQEQEAAI